jgi:hypothetical protein
MITRSVYNSCLDTVFCHHLKPSMISFVGDPTGRCLTRSLPNDALSALQRHTHPLPQHQPRWRVGHQRGGQRQSGRHRAETPAHPALPRRAAALRHVLLFVFHRAQCINAPGAGRGWGTLCRAAHCAGQAAVSEEGGLVRFQGKAFPPLGEEQSWGRQRGCRVSYADEARQRR